MRYYISDLHFYHENLNTMMDNRGFANSEEMNEYMIERWNNKVTKKDEVIILGDFSIEKAQKTTEILQRLNGKKHLIVGNHDKNFLEDKRFDRSLFVWIDTYREMKDEKRKVILCHYPIMCYNGQFYRNEKGEEKTYMLYGHVHNTVDEELINKFGIITRETKRPSVVSGELRETPCNMINCFCGFSDYTPLTLSEWIELDRKRREL